MRERLNQVGQRTIFGEYFSFMQEEYPKMSCEKGMNFRNKLSTVFQNLGWVTYNPPGRVGVRLGKTYSKLEEKAYIRQRGCENVYWKQEEGEKTTSDGQFKNIDI
uniref:Uncharacterized protein n=1 Tax=Rhipiliopsis peltata TaxID=2320810 RepID=A0A386B1E9_9CHLO|nr:hypothetical protein [Rhipiliopsis peltata]AYC65508.1 hypothetical protein [Rhipiliopsis peltata]